MRFCICVSRIILFVAYHILLTGGIIIYNVSFIYIVLVRMQIGYSMYVWWMDKHNIYCVCMFIVHINVCNELSCVCVCVCMRRMHTLRRTMFIQSEKFTCCTIPKDLWFLSAMCVRLYVAWKLFPIPIYRIIKYRKSLR